MRPLSLLLLAVLVTISVIKVESVHGDDEDHPRPRINSPGSTDDEKFGMFDPKAIRKALGTIYENEDVELSDIFIKILTELKKDLDPQNAKGFVERMSQIAVKTSLWPHLHIFVEIVDCFQLLKDDSGKSDQAVRDLVYDKLDFLIGSAEDDGTMDYVVSQIITSSMVNLLTEDGDNTEDLARTIVTSLLMDLEIEEEIAYFVPEESVPLDTPHTIVKSALRYAESYAKI